MFSDDDFKPAGLFGSRGIRPEVADDAFFPYDQGDLAQLRDAYRRCGSEARPIDEARAMRAPGIVMRRFPVPGADPDITPEMRPARPILTPPVVSGRYFRPHHHEWMKPEVRAKHVRRAKNRPEDVEAGCTPAELAEIQKMVLPHEWELTLGGDHFGVDIESHYGAPMHIHVPIAKYLFKASPTVDAWIGEHSHAEDFGDELVEVDEDDDLPFAVEMWPVHRRKFHPYERPNLDRLPDPATSSYEEVYEVPVDPMPAWDQRHPHHVKVKNRDIAMAKRLSSHPMGLARIAGADRVFMALEGCLKEAALVSAGEATFSCPSVSLWDAPELDDFARDHLRGKTVFVVCDSDWNDGHHEQVTRLTLLARDRLRRVLQTDDVHAAAPPEADDGSKQGVDDFLGAGGSVDNLVVWDLRPRVDVREEITRRTDRRVQKNGLDRDEPVANWLITHADPVTGESTVALSTIARNLYDELGRETVRATERAVQESVAQLVKDGIVREIEPLSLRRGFNALGATREWLGKLQVVEELRAEVVEQRVAEPRS